MLQPWFPGTGRQEVTGGEVLGKPGGQGDGRLCGHSAQLTIHSPGASH